jgi:hypothetical protein
MQQRHIPYLLEWLAIGILAFNIPYIYSLLAKLAFIIPVPRDIDIMTLKDQGSPPVEDLKLIAKHLLPYRREEELVNLSTSCRQISTLNRAFLIRCEDRREPPVLRTFSGHPCKAL